MTRWIGIAAIAALALGLIGYKIFTRGAFAWPAGAPRVSVL